MDVVICFDEISIDNTQYFLSIFVEEETVTDVWTPIAESFGQRIDGTRGIHIVKFVIQSRFAGDIGQPFSISGGLRYNSNENPSERLRVRIEAIEFNPNGQDFVASVNITGAYRLY